ncbi:hypothetical protein [Noviherbaspirillum sp.]|uniref:hypothetical protein n=1 Tax=Noviherbaspirillum sp. TaxID=1926288 RepID=UPI002B4667A7|nr:hypothetical protein [Noviherbaspirillum sp.]HJV82975.1 hypothetical protein [Noviherbaspirillum sp.]
MFIGHYSAAFAARRAAPAASLPTYFIACQLVDLCWSVLVLLGVEKLRVIPGFTASNGLDLYFMPYTHSLAAAIIWSLGAAFLFWLFTPSLAARFRTAAAVGMAVGSHWLLDLLVHVPDLPLWFDDVKVGLGWWNYRAFALLLELALLWAGVLLCLGRVAENRARYLVLAVLMSAIQIASLIMHPAQAEMVALELLVTHAALIGGAWWACKLPAASALPEAA